MKRFLVFVMMLFVASIVLMLVNDSLNRHLIFSLPSSSAYKMHRLVKGYPADEVAILGSSRAETGFAPNELSPNAFNYGLSGSSFRETMFHLKCCLARPDKGVIIVNVDPYGMGTWGFCGNYRFATGTGLVESEPDRIRISLADRIPGVRCHGMLRRNLALLLNAKLSLTRTLENGATLQRISRLPEEWDYIIAHCESKELKRESDLEKELGNMLSNNARHEVVFVVSPIATPWLERFKGMGELKKIKDWLSSFPHVRVLDFTDPSYGFGLSEFMDLTHLNEKGARRFTALLREQLTKLSCRI